MVMMVTYLRAHPFIPRSCTFFILNAVSYCTMGKSAAKIRRNTARAAARGETYTPPEPIAKAVDENVVKGSGESEEVVQKKLTAAQKLEDALATLEANTDNLNAKERRSAKRRVEAIAAEESGCDVVQLTEWYKRHNASTRGKKKKGKRTSNPAATIDNLSVEDKAKLEAAKKLSESLSKMENDDSLNAKERRSSKRKAEAIASEETGGTPSNELLEWYKTIVPQTKTTSEQKENKTLCIIFVGQLAYSTTADMLFDHFHSTLGKDVITKETIKIRVLKDTKTKKSRGMAFLELETPEVMYECLKLHLTHLDGRRINGE